MERWPHVKRNWIKAIKAIRNGRLFKNEYIWWNIRKDWLHLKLTEEQENEIAENIFDWWISGKSYKQWYAEKFCQLKLDFKDKE